LEGILGDEQLAPGMSEKDPEKGGDREKRSWGSEEKARGAILAK